MPHRRLTSQDDQRDASQSILSILRSIRHPSPTVASLPGLLTQGVEGIYIKHVRLALTRDGSSYYVVPVASVSNGHQITSRCKAAMTAALHAELPQIPSRLRQPTLRLQAEQQRTFDQFGARGVCLLIESRYDVSGVCATSATELARQGMLTNIGLLSGLVPDGVATVTASYPASQTTSAMSATVHVVKNVFVTNIHITERDRTHPTLTWRSANGTIIKTMPGAQCSTNPGFCGGRATSKPGTRPCQ